MTRTHIYLDKYLKAPWAGNLLEEAFNTRTWPCFTLGIVLPDDVTPDVVASSHQTAVREAIGFLVPSLTKALFSPGYLI